MDRYRSFFALVDGVPQSKGEMRRESAMSAAGGDQTVERRGTYQYTYHYNTWYLFVCLSVFSAVVSVLGVT